MATKTQEATAADVRAWAAENSETPVGVRGRIPASVIQEFNKGSNKSRGGLGKFTPADQTV